jgi:outer membrane protein TolC
LYENRVLIKSIAARRLEAREKNMELSLEQFKTGTINSFDYRLIQVEYLQAALANLEAVYNLIDSNTSLLRLTGGILEIIDEE